MKGHSRVSSKHPGRALRAGKNSKGSHHEVREISPDGRILIARSGERFLEETSPGMGRVLIPSENYEGPIHRIFDIVKYGYWTPIAEDVKRIAEKVLSETTFNHSQKRKEVRKRERKGKTDHGHDG